MNRKAKTEFTDSDYEVKVTGRHIEVSDSMKNYALEKMAKIDRFTNRVIDADIIMDIQKLEHTVEIIIKAWNIKVTARASSNDMYSSIDKAFAKLESQLLRYKSKLQDHHAKGHAILDMEVEVIPKPLDNDFGYEEKESSADSKNSSATPQVLKKESLPLKILTTDEAIMKMELSEERSFMLFKDEANMKLRVIYRREDGNYGIIEPVC